MAMNWVMLPEDVASPTTFLPLPNEKTVYTSSHRTSLSLTSPKSTYPAHNSNVNINSSDGICYLTNQRIVYLPKTSSATFKSFSCPLLNLHDTHLVMPWFGPNAWTALVQPVPGGNLPNTSSAVELRLTFKEGGAPVFQSTFEAIKERLQQVVDVARQANTSLGGVDLANVHLDQLPSYQDIGHDRIAHQPDLLGQEEPIVVPTNATSDQVRAMAAAHRQQQDQQSRASSGQRPVHQHETEIPSDAPPGYEEAQQHTLQVEADWRRDNEMT